MSSDETKPREFQIVESLEERSKLILEAQKTVSSVFFWTRHQKLTLSSFITKIDTFRDDIILKIPTGTDPQKFVETLEEVQDKDCFFSISLTRTMIFFKSTFKGMAENGFRFQYPIDVYRVQRRKDMRVPIPEGMSLVVKFKLAHSSAKSFDRAVKDISASGMAIELTENDSEYFKRGDELNHLEFTLLDRKITCDAEIRYVRTEPTTRIGIQFKRIKSADQQAIAAYVFEQSRRYFSKFIE